MKWGDCRFWRIGDTMLRGAPPRRECEWDVGEIVHDETSLPGGCTAGKANPSRTADPLWESYGAGYLRLVSFAFPPVSGSGHAAVERTSVPSAALKLIAPTTSPSVTAALLPIDVPPVLANVNAGP